MNFLPKIWVNVNESLFCLKFYGLLQLPCFNLVCTFFFFFLISISIVFSDFDENNSVNITFLWKILLSNWYVMKWLYNIINLKFKCYKFYFLGPKSITSKSSGHGPKDSMGHVLQFTAQGKRVTQFSLSLLASEKYKIK